MDTYFLFLLQFACSLTEVERTVMNEELKLRHVETCSIDCDSKMATLDDRLEKPKNRSICN